MYLGWLGKMSFNGNLATLAVWCHVSLMGEVGMQHDLWPFFFPLDKVNPKTSTKGTLPLGSLNLQQKEKLMDSCG